MNNKIIIIPILIIIMGLACFAGSTITNNSDVTTISDYAVCEHVQVCSNDGESPYISGGSITPFLPNFDPNH